MSSIGFIPTKTAILVREPDGDAGTIPAATEAAAGVMTARHVQMLEEVYQMMHQNSSAVVIERPADTSQFLTKLEAKALIQQLPKVMETPPEVRALRLQLDELHDKVLSAGRMALGAPEAQQGSPVDAVARQILEGVISGMEAIDNRLSRVESVLETITQVAERKARVA